MSLISSGYWHSRVVGLTTLRTYPWWWSPFPLSPIMDSTWWPPNEFHNWRASSSSVYHLQLCQPRLLLISRTPETHHLGFLQEPQVIFLAVCPYISCVSSWSLSFWRARIMLHFSPNFPSLLFSLCRLNDPILCAPIALHLLHHIKGCILCPWYLAQGLPPYVLNEWAHQ